MPSDSIVMRVVVHRLGVSGLSIGEKLGATEMFELPSYLLSQGDIAAAFEKRLAEMRKAGTLSFAAPGASRPGGPTLWDRLRGSRDSA